MVSTIILTILLFLVPIIWFSIPGKLYQNFSLKNFVRTLNKALIIQGFCGILMAIISKYLDTNIDSNIEMNFWEYLFFETTYYFTVIGLFYYLPPLVILNLITKSWKR